MEFLTELKKTIQHSLARNDLLSARELITQFHTTKLPSDDELLALEATLCEQEHLPVIADYLRANGHDKQRRIVLYEGVYDIMDYTAEQFRKSFEALGHIVYVFHHKDTDNSCNSLIQFCQAGVDAVILFNNIGLFLKTNTGQNLWDCLKIPCVNFLFDHPMYYFDSLDEVPASCIVSCVDRNHVAYIKRYYPMVHNSFFLPLGGEAPNNSTSITWSERSLDILYVGSLKVVPSEEDPFYQTVFHYLLEHPEVTTEEALIHCASKEFILTVEEEKLLVQKYRFLDTNINSYYRLQMIQVLINADIDVTVYGKGWDNTPCMKNPHFHYKGYLTQPECLKLMCNSKIVLNSMPWFKDGAHDRIFNAMLAGAISVTDSSAYLLQNFEDKKDLFFYSLTHMEELPQIVRRILCDTNSANVALHGQKKASALHTWQNRSIELLQNIVQHYSY